MRKLTERERRCLAFLSDKMDADGKAIGQSIAPSEARSPRGYAMIGNGEARRLSFDRPSLVMWVGRGPLWAITAAGRAALQTDRDGGGHD